MRDHPAFIAKLNLKMVIHRQPLFERRLRQDSGRGQCADIDACCGEGLPSYAASCVLKNNLGDKGCCHDLRLGSLQPALHGSIPGPNSIADASKRDGFGCISTIAKAIVLRRFTCTTPTNHFRRYTNERPGTRNRVHCNPARRFAPTLA